MLLANPFTGQVLNANPRGCNQYSGPECTGYHGTRGEIEEFRRGPGPSLDRYGTWFNTDRETAKTYSYGSKEGTSGRILKTKLELGKVAPENLFKKLVEHFANEGEDDPLSYDEMYIQGTSGDEFAWAQGQALRILRRAGYNSVGTKSPDGGTDYVVIDPSKSKILSSEIGIPRKSTED
jgi:hypothetical protein